MLKFTQAKIELLMTELLLYLFPPLKMYDGQDIMIELQSEAEFLLRLVPSAASPAPSGIRG
jgi:hypothetical protein